jgi:hypothetical protein
MFKRAHHWSHILSHMNPFHNFIAHLFMILPLTTRVTNISYHSLHEARGMTRTEDKKQFQTATIT